MVGKVKHRHLTSVRAKRHSKRVSFFVEGLPFRNMDHLTVEKRVKISKLYSAVSTFSALGACDLTPH